MTTKSYLQGLDNGQLAAVLAPPTPLAVMAGAGAGKTKMVTARIANQIEHGFDPSSLFVAAFTRAAANEMGERMDGIVSADGLDISTFHSIMYRFLNSFRDASNLPTYNLFKEGRKKILMTNLLGKPNRDHPDAINVDADIGNVMGWIGRWKNAGIHWYDPEIKETQIEAVPGSDIHAASLVYPLYEHHLKTENAIDFDDMLLKGMDLLAADEDALSLAKSKWSGFFVDEAQDTNILQWRILELIAPPDTSPNLTAVGDLRQCIFSFRGATPEIFEQFIQRYKGANMVDLVNNYRCVGTVVTAANLLAGNMGMSDQKSIRGGGVEPVVQSFLSPADQALAIAADVAALREEGMSGGDAAVLIRTNAQSAVIESAFVGAGLPYWCNGGGFFDRMEVGDIMAYVRLANDSSRTDLLERIINRPTRYLGKAFAQAVEGNMPKYDNDIVKAIRFTDTYSGRKLSPKQRQSAVELSDLLMDIREGDTQISPLIAIVKILSKTDYLDWLRKNNGMADDADSSRLENIEALKSTAAGYTSIKDFLEFVDECSRLQIESNDATHISTVHRAKGSEWKHVWIANMHDDSIPHAMAKKEGDLIGERRLAYVAFTRAKDFLKIGVPATNEKGGPVEPSRFIQTAGLTLQEPQAPVLADAEPLPAS